jgi:hypothetical protein
MTEKKQIPEGYMEDAKGRLVPREAISEYDLLRDQVVRELIDIGKETRDQMKKTKARIMDEMAALVATAGDKYGVNIGGSKGNVSLTSYDGRFQVKRSISMHLEFDERIRAAKELIDECILEWSQNSCSELKTLVSDAFALDGKGNLSVDRILRLTKLEIDDPKWKKAMDAIRDSLQVVGSKTYFRMYERENPEDPWKPIALDMAAI